MKIIQQKQAELDKKEMVECVVKEELKKISKEMKNSDSNDRHRHFKIDNITETISVNGSEMLLLTMPQSTSPNCHRHFWRRKIDFISGQG